MQINTGMCPQKQLKCNVIAISYCVELCSTSYTMLHYGENLNPVTMNIKASKYPKNQLVNPLVHGYSALSYVPIINSMISVSMLPH